MATFNIEDYLNSLPKDVTFNIEDYLNSLPEDIEEINISNLNLTYIPSLERFIKLKILYCGTNKLTSLPNLPNTLKELYCSSNKLTRLPNLSNTLRIISCSNNKLTRLPNLPNTLERLYCYYNKLTSLPILPNTLKELYCYKNLLPFEDIKSWNQFNKFKQTFYKLKFSRRLERYYIKNIRNKNINEEIIDIIYSPEYNFFKRLLNQDIIKMFK
jgi:Leucine-rich repeat (LRR) protein